MEMSAELKEYIRTANINLPTECPECHGKIEITDNGFVRCVNPACKRKVVHKFATCLEILGVLGAGDSMLSSFVDNGITTISALFKYVPNMYQLGENAYKVSEQIKKALDKSFTIAQYIAMFDIDGFSERKLAGLDTCDEFSVMRTNVSAFPFDMGAERLASVINIDGFGSYDAKLKFFNGLVFNKQDILDTAEFIHMEAPSDNGLLKGMSFCFTGAMAYKRPVLEKLVRDNGGDVKGVSKGLDYLVQADENSTSTKSKKAKELGTKIISPESFIGLLTNLGVNVNI